VACSVVIAKSVSSRLIVPRTSFVCVGNFPAAFEVDVDDFDDAPQAVSIKVRRSSNAAKEFFLFIATILDGLTHSFFTHRPDVLWENVPKVSLNKLFSRLNLRDGT